MTRSTRRLPSSLVPGLCLTLLTSLLSGCDGVCTANGREYPAGASYAIECNQCTCGNDGSQTCTLIACATPPEEVECSHQGATYRPGETWAADCNTCTCQPDGQVVCTRSACAQPCIGADGATHQPGETFPSADGCNTCSCGADGQIGCTEKACAATCTLGGKTYQAGEGFTDALGCNGCACSADGHISCTARWCDPAEACSKGDAQFASGNHVVCEDGCNTCICDNTSWSSTDAACPALPMVERCPSDARGIEQARVLYRAGDKLAVEVGTGGCATDTPSFKLCFDGSFRESNPVQVTLDLVPSGATPTCSAWVTQEKVFDLSPLRAAFQSGYPGVPGSIIVGLENTSFTYTF